MVKYNFLVDFHYKNNLTYNRVYSNWKILNFKNIKIMAKTNNQKPSSPKTKVPKNIPSHRSSKKERLMNQRTQELAQENPKSKVSRSTKLRLSN